MKIWNTVTTVQDWFAKSLGADRTPLPKPISDHIARDIGMSQAELEWHRLTWPSQSKDRPPL